MQYFKFIILTCFCIFIINNKAFSYESEYIYKNCLSYKNNSFELQNEKHLICHTYIKGIKDTLETLCFVRKLTDRENKLNYYFVEWGSSITGLINAFINYTEKNPQNMKEETTIGIVDWAAKTFPCKK